MSKVKALLVKLNNGNKIPGFGLGTLRVSDKIICVALIKY